MNHPQYGIATYVRDNIKDVTIEYSMCGPDVFVSAIKLKDLNVVNVYKPPSRSWSTNIPTLSHPCLYAGDFNSHHTTWRYNSNDSNGIQLVEWSENNNLQLVFNAKDRGSFKSARWKRDYNPDLTFVTRDTNGIPLQTNRCILTDFPNSQHRPVIMEIGIKIPLANSMPLPRWNFQRANWGRFAADMDAAIRWIPAKVESYTRFTKLLIATAKKSIPIGYRKSYIPCWTKESEQLYEEFKKTGDHEIGEDLIRSLNDNRRNKWEKTVESMDFKTSSRKAWRVLNKLCGKSGNTCHTASKTLTNSIANQIVDVSRVKGPKADTKAIKKLATVRKGTLKVDQNLSRNFSQDELVKHYTNSIQFFIYNKHYTSTYMLRYYIMWI